MSLWFFQRPAPGAVARIPLPAMQRFLAGETSLPPDADGFVRCIGVSVMLEGRKASAVQRVWFSRVSVDGKGRVDPQRRPSLLQAVRAPQPSREGGVIPALHLFAERRLHRMSEWSPELSDIEALRVAVNRRAGKPLL